MTSEDQDAIVGRTIRQLRDVREKLARLKTKAHAMGNSFATVPHHLHNKPELIRFEHESTDTYLVT